MDQSNDGYEPLKKKGHAYHFCDDFCSRDLAPAWKTYDSVGITMPLNPPFRPRVGERNAQFYVGDGSVIIITDQDRVGVYELSEDEEQYKLVGEVELGGTDDHS